jgi:hypothetical protein
MESRDDLQANDNDDNQVELEDVNDGRSCGDAR